MIDLGTEPIAATLPSVTLDRDELDLLVDVLHIDELPVVLDAGPRFDSVRARDAALERGRASLTSAGRLDGETVHFELARWLLTLARPRSEIALRWHVDGSVSRLCLARDDDGAVLALRGGETFLLQPPGHDPLGTLAHTLGTSEPLPFAVINRPTAELSTALDRISHPDTAAAELIAIGVPAPDAAIVGPALAGCNAFAEIVGIAHEDGYPDLIRGPVTVYDTAAGRAVGTTSVAADGVAWTSLSPGTPVRLRQALTTLLSQSG
ncbi:ESX secretion-associated protein EspG [Rhodococcus sp. ABRD24]|uniref:ESX secretion-associated protein EspG n=1 Tax=Rhodococcus sp. ABRD24 TaxID=2507582 RepID=UPI00103D73CF|nr:ESX secretion-associated protein EspG [Rhodococcus sp. ABRD24]QBJ96671.1 ESX secretion-associated protein EspG [Rhodococcus sp. ABRD24]